jgi:hypothetical protein
VSHLSFVLAAPSIGAFSWGIQKTADNRLSSDPPQGASYHKKPKQQQNRNSMHGEANLFDLYRRQFLLTASCSAARTLLLPPLQAAARRALSPKDRQVTPAHRLDCGWHFRLGAIRGIDGPAGLHPVDKNGGVPIAVLCDNSPDRDRAPSDLSDFSLYGDFQVGKRQNIDSCSCSNSRTTS